MRLISPAAAAMTVELLVDRLRAALWGIYIGAFMGSVGPSLIQRVIDLCHATMRAPGDALAMPCHWYYDSLQKVRRRHTPK